MEACHGSIPSRFVSESTNIASDKDLSWQIGKLLFLPHHSGIPLRYHVGVLYCIRKLLC
jgi:hypothetical protein